MFWPFKRKPKIVDRRVNGDWRVGDVAVCVSANWDGPPQPDHPKVGDVLRVREVGEGVGGFAPALVFYLSFGGFRRYDTAAFRKIDNDTGFDFREQLRAKPKVLSYDDLISEWVRRRMTPTNKVRAEQPLGTSAARASLLPSSGPGGQHHKSPEGRA